MTARAAGRSESVTLKVHIPLAIRKRGGRKLVIAPARAEVTQAARWTNDDRLLTTIARAHRWQRLFESGAHRSISDLAAAEGVDRSRVGKVMRLMLLAHDLIAAILDGTETETMSLDQLLVPFPDDWRRQRDELLR